MIERNTTIPTRHTKTFSTAANNQTSVEIHVLQGERAKAQDNITLGRFSLVGIPPAPRGTPKIDVTFDIDSNGIVHVSAKDQGTGQEQKIVIESQTSLSDDEIQKKVAEAEKYAEQDKQIREQTQVKNEAEAMVYQFDQTVEQLGDKISEQDKEMLKEKKSRIEDALKTDDFEQIKKAKEEFEKAFSGLAQKIYGQPGAQGAGPQDFDPSNFDPSQFTNMGGQADQGGSSSGSDDYVDVDYEVSDVDDDEE
jgi:molecular chaperone DnaK